MLIRQPNQKDPHPYRQYHQHYHQHYPQSRQDYEDHLPECLLQLSQPNLLQHPRPLYKYRHQRDQTKQQMNHPMQILKEFP